jgi:hypothetical protein
MSEFADIQRLTNIWYAMRARCYKPNHIEFHRYGGRGIKICDEWLKSRDAFIKWALLNGYSNDLSIDRINNDGCYCPENCRWATRREQRQNGSQKILFVNLFGKMIPLREACEKYGIRRSQIDKQLYRRKKEPNEAFWYIVERDQISV